MKNSSNPGGIIVRHREYVADIEGTTNFVNREYPLNPGLIKTFPWLSQVADAFEEYRIRGMVFEYKSLYADATVSSSDTGGLGSVIMCTNYNAN